MDLVVDGASGSEAEDDDERLVVTRSSNRSGLSSRGSRGSSNPGFADATLVSQGSFRSSPPGDVHQKPKIQSKRRRRRDDDDEDSNDPACDADLLDMNQSSSSLLGNWVVHASGSALREEQDRMLAESVVEGGLVMGTNTRTTEWGKRGKVQPYVNKHMKKYARYLRLGDRQIKKTIRKRWGMGLVKWVLSGIFYGMVVLTFLVQESIILILSLFPVTLVVIYLFVWEVQIANERNAAMRKFWNVRHQERGSAHGEPYDEKATRWLPNSSCLRGTVLVVRIVLFYLWVGICGALYSADDALNYRFLLIHLFFMGLTYVFFQLAFPFDDRVSREYAKIGLHKDVFALPPPCCRFEQPLAKSKPDKLRIGNDQKYSRREKTAADESTTPMTKFAVASFDEIEEVFLGWNLEVFHGSAQSIGKILIPGGTRDVRVPEARVGGEDEGEEVDNDAYDGTGSAPAKIWHDSDDSDGEISDSEEEERNFRMRHKRSSKKDDVKTMRLKRQKKKMYWLCFRVRRQMELEPGCPPQNVDSVYASMLSRPWPCCGGDYSFMEPNARRAGIKPKYAEKFLKLMEVRRPELAGQIRTILAIVTNDIYGPERPPQQRVAAKMPDAIDKAVNGQEGTGDAKRDSAEQREK